MSKKSRVVQLNNQYIQDELMRQRYEEDELKKRHRFLGLAMVLMVLLFILPTYNMVVNYIRLTERKAEIKVLEEEYKAIAAKTEEQEYLAKRLQDETYVEKYARAKYYYSLEGEVVYLLPDLLPK